MAERDGSRGMPAAVTDLRLWLDTAGPEPDPDELASRLALAWRSFWGAGETRMRPGKLHGRIEQPRWQPPVLSFLIERHGPTVSGSVYAEVHQWHLDLDHLTAIIPDDGRRRRLVGLRNPPLKVQPIARMVAEAVERGATDVPYLKWLDADAGLVRILIAHVPQLETGSAVAETLLKRRRRFRHALAEELALMGFFLDDQETRSLHRFRRRSRDAIRADLET